MNIQPSSPRRQRTQTDSSNLAEWDWREKGTANSLASYSACGRDAHPLFLVKPVGDFVASLVKASSLNRAMDLLAEAVEQLGFLRMIYSWMPATRLADGRWAPLPLILWNLPPRWERQWPRHSPNDPYYHACFENNLDVEWSTIQGQNAQDIACIVDRSVETVRTHLKRAGSKLDATNRMHAAAKAVFLGLIECP
jgi:DNA-binding CsgD family transcriptional regulator